MIHLYIQKTEGDQSAAAHAILEQVLQEDYGISAPVFQLGAQGKPFLPDGPWLNISHSRGYAAVAISDQPVGLDMELVRPFHEKLPERIFSKGELNWFRDRSCCRVDFFTLWTLKESYYKYLGTGLPGFPNGTDFYYDGAWHLKESDLWFHVLEEKTLLLSICAGKQSEIMIHRM